MNSEEHLSFFIHPSLSVYLSCFHVFASVVYAALELYFTFLCIDFMSFGNVPRSGVAAWYGRCISSSLGPLFTDVCSGYIRLHSKQAFFFFICLLTIWIWFLENCSFTNFLTRSLLLLLSFWSSLKTFKIFKISNKSVFSVWIWKLRPFLIVVPAI